MATLHDFGFSPYIEDTISDKRSTPEPCVVSFFDRVNLDDNLINILFEQRALVVQPVGASANENISLDGIRSIKLAIPVNIKRSVDHFRKRGISVHAIGRRLPFNLKYRDGQMLAGELHGYGMAQGGLGIYLVHENGGETERGIRCYFPVSSIDTFTVGEHLGKVLLEQKDLTEAGLQTALAVQRKLRAQKLGHILLEKRVVDQQQLEQAIREQATAPVRRLGEVLIETGLISEEQLHAALDEQGRRRGKPLGEILTEMGLVSKDVIREVLAQKLGKETDNTLVKLVNKIVLDAKDQGASDIHIEPRPGKENTRIRFRRDGILYDYLEVPSRFRSALISRVKIMANLDISERRRAQDGKIDFKRFGPARIELRVATIPTNNNLESVVLRILTSTKPLPLDKLQLAPHVLESLRTLAETPYGLILVCGPTGSGKTTTLHSIVGHINTPERKIWTAEDPVEITQPGLSQVQVNTKIGWTFATALRSFLRADPDVIVVGEMRDQETAQIGVEASLTGHLVLSTLHTNSAAESVTRLLDMGLDPFNFADALLCVLAQRLARRLCPDCKLSRPADEAAVAALAQEYCLGTALEPATVIETWNKAYATKGRIMLNAAAGCKECGKTGFRGRIAIHELLVVTPTIRHLIRMKSPVSEIVPVAMANGMRTLKQDGIEKVLQGFTTIERVRAVCS